MEKVGGNEKCTECHTDLNKPKIREFTKDCLECHKNMLSKGALIEASTPVIKTEAVGYMSAMHGLCIKCHEEEQKTLPVPNENLSRCTNCHRPLPAMTDEVWKSRL
jgi:hypothetical protein